MKSKLFTLLGALAVLALAIVTACSTGAPKQTELMEEFGIEEVTTRELQLIIYGFAVHCAGTVELAAQAIQDSSDSPEIRENAILWKINAVPVFYRAAFGHDPLGSTINTWALCVQQRQFFTTGAGNDLFGNLQDIAVNASREIEKDAVELARTVLVDKDIQVFEEGLESYATDNPFDNLLFVRGGDSTNFLKNVAGTSAGGLAAAASMSEEMRSLADRMSIFTVSVPKQVQWHAELMMAQAPELIAEQRDSAIAVVQKESWNTLEPFMEFMSKERELIAANITRERSAVLEGIAAERIAVLEALVQERNFLLEQVASERNMTMEQLNALTLASIEHMIKESGEFSRNAIDHVVWRLLQLLALPFAALVIFCVVVLLLIRNGVNRYLRLLAVEKGRSQSGPMDTV